MRRPHPRPRAATAGPVLAAARLKVISLLIGTGVVVSGVALTVAFALEPDPASSTTSGPRGSVPVHAEPSDTGPSGAVPGDARSADDEAADTGPASGPAGDGAARDALAARPMEQVPSEYTRPMPVSPRDPGTLVIPAASRIGAAGVPTGFPHTPAGAMAQMIAIDQTAMQSGSLTGVREVIRAWAVPGGPTAETWSGVSAMASLLTGAGLSGDGSRSLRVVVTPAMGLIKGSVGSDFVVPCVDFEFDVTLTQTVRQAAADCERMVWTGGRWMIGPGREPAPGTSVWPDTDRAISAGYRDLSVAAAPVSGPGAS